MLSMRTLRVRQIPPRRTLLVPQSLNYSAGVQRELGWGTVIDVTYAGWQMRHGEMSTNINSVPDGVRFLDALQNARLVKQDWKKTLADFDFDVIQRSYQYLFREGMTFTVTLTLLALLVFGAFKGRFTGASPLRSGFQTLIIGGVAAAAAFLIAKAIS